MYLADAYEDILTRKAEEAPGGIAPLNYSWTSPDYDPTKFAPEVPAGTVAPQQIVITAKKIPPVPAPIQIPLLNFTQLAPASNPWDQITARRAAMPVQSTRSNYWPWIIGGLAGLAALLMLTGDKKPAASPARRPSPTRRAAHARRVSYARRRR